MSRSLYIIYERRKYLIASLRSVPQALEAVFASFVLLYPFFLFFLPSFHPTYPSLSLLPSVIPTHLSFCLPSFFFTPSFHHTYSSFLLSSFFLLPSVLPSYLLIFLFFFSFSFLPSFRPTHLSFFLLLFFLPSYLVTFPLF